MADRVQDAEDVDHCDRGYKYPLGHLLNDWDAPSDASAPCARPDKAANVLPVWRKS
jgi:hypothetical protein